MEEISLVKQSVEQQLICLKSVSGIGIGNKWVNGHPTDQPAIIVFVEKKKPINTLLSKFSASEVIPPHIDGVPTDIVEVGVIVKQGNTTKVRPIVPGYSCSHQKVTAGTIGGMFLDRDNEPVILTNNHVAACENAAKIGDLIYQPGTIDSRGSMAFSGWSNPSTLPYFATLKDFAPITRDTANNQDSAIAAIHPSFISSGMISPIYPTINRPLSGFSNPLPNTQVQKVGRTTGYTTGQIIAIDSTFTIGYDMGPIKFIGCVVCNAMSAGGDSGSIIMNMNSEAVSLLFAGSNKVTLSSPIDTVVRRYGLKLFQNISSDPQHSFELDDGKWQTATVHGQITFKPDAVEMSSPASAYCVIQRDLSSFKSVRVTVNTGTDRGLSWGPGISIIFPNGSLKINLRRNNTYGAAVNNTETIGIGKVYPNKEYVLRIKKDNNTYIGEIMGDGVWTTVISVPISVFSGEPNKLLVGKTSKRGTLTDFSNLGETGTCSYSDLDVQL